LKKVGVLGTPVLMWIHSVKYSIVGIFFLNALTQCSATLITSVGHQVNKPVTLRCRGRFDPFLVDADRMSVQGL
jgi:hypothetical protein